MSFQVSTFLNTWKDIKNRRSCLTTEFSLYKHVYICVYVYIFFSVYVEWKNSVKSAPKLFVDKNSGLLALYKHAYICVYVYIYFSVCVEWMNSVKSAPKLFMDKNSGLSLVALSLLSIMSITRLNYDDRPLLSLFPPQDRFVAACPSQVKI